MKLKAFSLLFITALCFSCAKSDVLYGVASISGWLEYWTEIIKINPYTGETSVSWWNWFTARTNGTLSINNNEKIIYYTASPQSGVGAALYSWNIETSTQTTAWLQGVENIWKLSYQKSTNTLFGCISWLGEHFVAIDPQSGTASKVVSFSASANLSAVSAVVEPDRPLAYLTYNLLNASYGQTIVVVDTTKRVVKRTVDNSQMGYWRVNPIVFDPKHHRILAFGFEEHFKSGVFDVVAIDPGIDAQVHAECANGSSETWKVKQVLMRITPELSHFQPPDTGCAYNIETKILYINLDNHLVICDLTPERPLIKNKVSIKLTDKLLNIVLQN